MRMVQHRVAYRTARLNETQNQWPTSHMTASMRGQFRKREHQSPCKVPNKSPKPASAFVFLSSLDGELQREIDWVTRGKLCDCVTSGVSGAEMHFKRAVIGSRGFWSYLPAKKYRR